MWAQWVQGSTYRGAVHGLKPVLAFASFTPAYLCTAWQHTAIVHVCRQAFCEPHILKPLCKQFPAHGIKPSYCQCASVGLSQDYLASLMHMQRQAFISSSVLRAVNLIPHVRHACRRQVYVKGVREAASDPEGMRVQWAQTAPHLPLPDPLPSGVLEVSLVGG